MANQITLEQLAEKLGGKLWIKGDMKRIYLDRGYNTKKMTTKTYVFQKEDSSFGVSCFIDCPSQPFAWIKSQQEELINGVMEDIEAAIFEIENPGVDYYEFKNEEESKNKSNAAIAEFENTLDSKIKNNIEYFYTCKKLVEDYNKKLIAYQTMDDETRGKINVLQAEKASILGTPGSAKRKKEIDNELALLPCNPSEPHSWVLETASFATAEEYSDFKINETKKQLGLL